MVDIARLAIDVDDAGTLSTAVQDLGKLTQSAAATEQAVMELQGSSKALSTEVAATGVRARDASGRFVKMGTDAAEAGRKVRGAGDDAAVAAGRFARLGDATEQVGTRMGGTGLDARVLAMQLSQVGQQGMVTGNYLQAMAVQLPDIGLAFGAMGAAAGLAGAIILPMAANMLGLAGDSKEAEDAIDDLTGALQGYQDYANTARASTISLREEFGENAEAARRYAEMLANITLSGGLNDFRTNGTYAQQFRPLQEAFQELRAMERQLETTMANMGTNDPAVADPFGNLRRSIATQRQEVNELGKAWGMLPDEIDRFIRAQDRLLNARSVEQIEEASSAILEIWDQMGDRALVAPGAVTQAIAGIHGIWQEAARVIKLAGDESADTGAEIADGVGTGADVAQQSLGELLQALNHAHNRRMEAAAEGRDADVESWQSVEDATRAAIEQQLSGTAAARESLEEMKGTLEAIIKAAEEDMGNVQLNLAAEAARDLLTEVNGALENVTELNAADLSKLTGAFSGVLDIARQFLESIGLISEGMNSFQTPNFSALEGTPSGEYNKDLAQAIAFYAEKYRVTPEELAAVISYETAGTFSPTIPGPASHGGIGLYQAGPNERATYRYDPYSGNAFEQMASLDRYLRDRGFLPGMGIGQLYSTINAGQPGRMGAVDVNGDPNNRTVAAKVEEILSGGHARAGEAFWAAYGATVAQRDYANNALITRAGLAIDRGEAAMPSPPGAPPVRPMDLGVPEIVAPGRPQVRPFELAEDHAEGLREMSEAARELLAATDPLIDKELRLAEASRQLDEAVRAGAIAPEERTRILNELSAAIDEDMAGEIEQVEGALNGLLGQMDEGADIAAKFAEAQRIVGDALEAGVIKTTEEADAILERFRVHLIMSSDSMQENLQTAEDAIKDRNQAFEDSFDSLGNAMARILVYGEDWREQFSQLLLSAASDLISSGFSSLFQSGFSMAFPSMNVPMGSSAIPYGISSFAGGGHTGYGTRSGGLDGQGGFLALLHPQEEVADEYAKNGSGGQKENVYYINVTATGNKEVRDMVREGISMAFSANRMKEPDRLSFYSSSKNARDR